MINWIYFPKNKQPDELSKQVVNVFNNIATYIDSFSYSYSSNEVLEIVRPGLENIGFIVEKSKKAEDTISVPVLFGLNGRVEKSFEADCYKESSRYIIEVEAGRAVVNFQFLKDFFEACAMSDIDKLCIAVRNTYRTSADFEKVCRFFEAMYLSGRIDVPLSGLLIIGY